MKKRFSTRRINFDLSTKFAGDSRGIGLAKCCYNVKIKNDKMICANGAVRFNWPQDIDMNTSLNVVNPPCEMQKVWKYNYKDSVSGQTRCVMFALGIDWKLYQIDLFDNNREYKLVMDKTFAKVPYYNSFVWVKKNGAMFCSDSDDLVFFEEGTTPQVATSGTKFCSICYYRERLFGLTNSDEGVLKYTKEAKLFDWSETSELGEIEIHNGKGKMRTLVPLEEGILCIGDYEVVRVDIPRVVSMYSTNRILESGNKIYANTVVKVKDKIYFLAQDGLYYTDGYEVKKISLGFEQMIEGIDQKYAVSEAYEGKLYLALKMDFGEYDESVNNALIEINLEEQTYCITKGLDIKCLLAVCDKGASRLVMLIKDNVSVYQLTDDGIFGGNILQKYFESAEIDLDMPGKDKMLAEMYISANQSVEIKVCSDKGERTYLCNMFERNAKYCCKLSGKRFWLCLSSKEDLLALKGVELVFKVKND